MTIFKDAQDMVKKSGARVNWLKLIVALVGLIALSYAFAALLEYVKSRFNLNFYEFDTLAYISVFVAYVGGQYDYYGSRTFCGSYHGQRR